MKIGWDDEVPISIKLKWNKWVKNVNYLNDIVVQRCNNKDDINQNS